MTEERDDDVDPSDWLASQFDSSDETEKSQPSGAADTTGASDTAAAAGADVAAPVEQTTQLPSAESYFASLRSGTPAEPVLPPAQEQPAPTEAFSSQPPPVPPVDAAIDGSTQVLGAQPLGTADPVDESAATSALDSLFGDDRFRDQVAGPQPATAAVGGAVPPGEQTEPEPTAKRAPIPKNQKILLWIAGSLVGVLALVALFFLGTRLSDVFGAAPAATPTPSASPTPSPTPTVAPVGPVEPGEHRWDELLGGECIEPFIDPWQEEFTVIDCATAHTAQMVFRGLFIDELAAPFPGVDELHSRINLLCTPPTIIDYAAAGAYPDIQVSASFAADDQQWADGNRDFYCFATRSSGELLTSSIAIPQVAAPPAP